mmetsp:Transcript_23016/g.38047  ORF Transcript_23016/g.38047 Transcript_23016/m.38047 type:complete len:207 (-) Transcript_23016:34-654(-)
MVFVPPTRQLPRCMRMRDRMPRLAMWTINMRSTRVNTASIVAVRMMRLISSITMVAIALPNCNAVAVLVYLPVMPENVLLAALLSLNLTVRQQLRLQKPPRSFARKLNPIMTINVQSMEVIRVDTMKLRVAMVPSTPTFIASVCLAHGTASMPPISVMPCRAIRLLLLRHHKKQTTHRNRIRTNEGVHTSSGEAIVLIKNILYNIL